MTARLAAFLLLFAVPAFAQWTQVPQVLTDVFTVWANGDTIVAGADTATYVSTNAGMTWKKSARVAPGVPSVDAAFVRDGRLYEAPRIAFSAVGAQPIRGNEVRFAITMPAAGRASITLYDVRGRQVGERLERTFEAGPQVATLDGSALAPGVYVARLLADRVSASVRVVRTR